MTAPAKRTLTDRGRREERLKALREEERAVIRSRKMRREAAKRAKEDLA